MVGFVAEDDVVFVASAASMQNITNNTTTKASRINQAEHKCMSKTMIIKREFQVNVLFNNICER